jgi:hypothetical protein
MFAKIQNNQVVKYPYSWADLELDNPSTSFDDRFDLAGWYALTEASSESTLVEVIIPNRPSTTSEQKLSTASEPVLVDGHWQLQWSVVDLTVEEIQLNTTLATV